MANHADQDPFPANMMHAQNYRFYISIAGPALLQQGSSLASAGSRHDPFQVGVTSEHTERFLRYQIEYDITPRVQST